MVSDQQKLYWNPEILKSQPEYGKMKRKCFNLTENLKYLIYNDFYILQQNNNEYYFPLLPISPIVSVCPQVYDVEKTYFQYINLLDTSDYINIINKFHYFRIKLFYSIMFANYSI